MQNNIITREYSSRLTKSKHIFLRENPQFKKLFNKLKKQGISTIHDIQDKKIRQKIRNTMVETEVDWSFHLGDIPYLTFTTVVPMNGDFNKAIPQIIKLLEKI